jgi:xylan 1,4-beta-xylosidase
MHGRRLAVKSDSAVPLDDIIRHGVRQSPDVSALAALGTNELSVLVWHYHDDDVAGPVADIALALAGLPADVKSATVTHYRIDADHSNAFAAWQRMGSPLQPTAEQFAQLENAAQLATLGAPKHLSVTDGKALLTFDLPRQAVSLVVLKW